MPKSTVCRAKDPNTCPYHGAAATLTAFLDRKIEPVNPDTVQVGSVKHQAETAREALAAQGYTNAPMGFQSAWNNYFAVLDQHKPTSEQEFITETLGDLDYGRLRGGPSVMWVKEDANLHDEDIDMTPVSQAPDLGFEDSSYRAVVYVHTRNGGGNRECYCDGWQDDKHEEGCLSEKVSILENHPNHLADYDDPFDGTYADFFFSVPTDDRLREAAKGFTVARQQEIKQQALDSIKNGDIPFWAVMPEKPAAKKTMENMNRTQTVAYASASLPPESRQGYDSLKDETRANLAAAVKLLQKGDVDGFLQNTSEPVMRRVLNHTELRHYRDIASPGFKKAQEKEAERQKLMEQRKLLQTLSEEGKLPSELGDASELITLLTKTTQEKSYMFTSHRNNLKAVKSTLVRRMKEWKDYEEAGDTIQRLRDINTRASQQLFTRWPGPQK